MFKWRKMFLANKIGVYANGPALHHSVDVKLVWTDAGIQSGNRTTSLVIMRAVTSCQGKLT